MKPLAIASYPLPTFGEVVKSGNMPRVHGNGFLQLDLQPGYRLHVWDDGLPKQKVSSSVHDHIFGIESRIICGVLYHKEYVIVDNNVGHYNVYRAVAQPGTNNTILENSGRRVSLMLKHEAPLTPGACYYFAPFAFHDTGYRGTTATIMHKLPTGNNIQPRVLVPFDSEPDNEFDREGFDPDTLWPFVERALRLAHALERG